MMTTEMQAATLNSAVELRPLTWMTTHPVNLVDRLLIVLFCIFLVAPVVCEVTGLGYIATHDNHVLATRPTLPTDLNSIREFPAKVQAYINDNFGLRGGLITLNSLVRYGMGVSSVKTVVLGENGWLYYAYKYEKLLEQHTGEDIFQNGQVDHWVKTLEAVQKWMHERNIAFYITVAPDKPTIYPENLSAYPEGKVTRLGQIVNQLQKTHSRLEFIDPRPAFFEEKKRHLLYSKRDSHWNQRAALISYGLLMDRIRQRFPSLPAAKIEDFDPVQMYDPSDLAWHLNVLDLYPYIPPYPTVPLAPPAHKSLIGEELIEGLARRSPSHILSRELVQPKSGSGWGWPVTYHKTDLPDRPGLVVFADSFTDYVMGPTALYQTFRDPIFTHNNGARLNFNLIEEVKPDIVLVIMAERYLTVPPDPPPLK